MLGTTSLLGWIAALGVGLLGVDPPGTSHIYGGEEVDSCGWPSAIYLSGGGSCTGVLVHPRIVLTAAHCVTNNQPSSVRFGESSQTAAELVGTEYCRQGPGWTGATAQGQDYAYCLLSAAVTNVPIIPVPSGCERSAIQQGARIMHVGFGQDQDGNFGRKKMLDTQIDFVTGNGEIISGDNEEVICNGDSGGPTFVYLDPANGGDGSWRVAAIHSWAQGADPVDPNCFGQAGSVIVTQAIDWVEQDSGFDITPCADGDTWAPTAACTSVATEPWIGSGNYPSGCEMGEEIEFPAICGPGLDATPDDTPPVVTIVTPTQAQDIPTAGDVATVLIDVDAVDDGWGIETVELTVVALAADQEQVDARNEYQSWEWSTNLPAGQYRIEVVATDHAGNASEPEVVCFGVDESYDCDGGMDSDSDTDGGTDGGTDSAGVTTDDSDGGGSTTDASGGTSEAPEDESEDEDEDDGDTEGAVPPARGDGDESGCGCRARADNPSGLVLSLGLLGLAFVRRRRSA